MEATVSNKGKGHGRIQDLSNSPPFGRLTVVKYVGIVKGNRQSYSSWECKCECGNTVVVPAYRLRDGSTRSCGCLQKDAVRKTGASKKTHGQSNTREYRIWQQLINRCYNQAVRNYNRYGGRGITVCDRWRESFENFIEDMGTRPSPSHSIDRKDNNLGYCKENCRWATKQEQARNKSTTVWIEHDGKRMSAPDWSDVTGIKTTTLIARKVAGWTDEQIVTLPLGARRPMS